MAPTTPKKLQPKEDAGYAELRAKRDEVFAENKRRAEAKKAGAVAKHGDGQVEPKK